MSDILASRRTDHSASLQCWRLLTASQRSDISTLTRRRETEIHSADKEKICVGRFSTSRSSRGQGRDRWLSATRNTNSIPETWPEFMRTALLPVPPSGQAAWLDSAVTET